MKNIAIKYGLRMFAGFVLLFLFVHLLGYSDNYHLRILNGIVHIAFIYLAIREYRKTFPETHGNYLSGVAMGMYASAIGVGLFTISMCIFLIFNDPFFEQLKEQSPYHSYITPFSASFYIFTEGIAVALIISYIAMRIIDAKREEE